MVKPTVPPVPDDHQNNPSKEIIAGSGIYSKVQYGLPNTSEFFNRQTPYFYKADFPNTNIPNVYNFVTTTPEPLNFSQIIPHALRDSQLSNTSIHRIDDMNVINKYIHYVPAGTPPGLKTFDPRTFLAQSIVNFNIYSVVYR